MGNGGQGTWVHYRGQGTWVTTGGTMKTGTWTGPGTGTGIEGQEQAEDKGQGRQEHGQVWDRDRDRGHETGGRKEQGTGDMGTGCRKNMDREGDMVKTRTGDWGCDEPQG